MWLGISGRRSPMPFMHSPSTTICRFAAKNDGSDNVSFCSGLGSPRLPGILELPDGLQAHPPAGAPPRGKSAAIDASCLGCPGGDTPWIQGYIATRAGKRRLTGLGLAWHLWRQGVGKPSESGAVAGVVDGFGGTPGPLYIDPEPSPNSAAPAASTGPSGLPIAALCPLPRMGAKAGGDEWRHPLSLWRPSD